MLIPFLGLRANSLFLSTMVGIVPTEPSRGTGPQNRALLHRKAPIERPVDALCAALLTGSSRQRLNGFIGRTPASRRIGRAPICYSAPNICSSLPMVAISPAERSGMGNWGLFGLNSEREFANPDDAKGALPPAYPPLQTCRRPMVLQRKSNAGTMNPHRSSGDERAIADT